MDRMGEPTSGRQSPRIGTKRYGVNADSLGLKRVDQSAVLPVPNPDFSGWARTVITAFAPHTTPPPDATNWPFGLKAKSQTGFVPPLRCATSCHECVSQIFTSPGPHQPLPVARNWPSWLNGTRGDRWNPVNSFIGSFVSVEPISMTELPAATNRSSGLSDALALDPRLQ